MACLQTEANHPRAGGLGLLDPVGEVFLYRLGLVVAREPSQSLFRSEFFDSLSFGLGVAVTVRILGEGAAFTVQEPVAVLGDIQAFTEELEIVPPVTVEVFCRKGIFFR